MSRPVSRRAFVGAAASAAAALAAGPPRAGASARTPPAIDTHTHFYDPARPQGVPWPQPADSLLYRTHLPHHFRAVAGPHGVVGTVVVEASPWLEDNQWVLDLAADEPLVVGFVGNLQPGHGEFATHLTRFARNPLFRGIRLGAGALARGLGQPSFVADLRRLGDGDLALDLLGGEAMLPDVARLAEAAPGLRIVIDHLPFGAWDRDPATLRGALAEVAAMPRVYAKVSNVVRRVGERPVTDADVYRPGLDALWDLFGPERVLFGSNWPVSNRVAPFEVVHGVVADYVAGRGPADAERFFWRNSRAAYGWVQRGEAVRLLG